MKHHYRFLVLGICLVVLGSLLFLSSFPGLTGFAIFEGYGAKVGRLIGAAFFISGILILMSHVRSRRSYELIAARIYETLGTRNAYGHKTEQVSVVEGRIAAHGPFSKKDVSSVVRSEISSGRLSLDRSGYAISISENPENVRAITRKYGRKIKSTVVDRLHDLEERRLPSGVR